MKLSTPMLAIVGLLALYAGLAWSAVSRKSAIYDESLHVASSLAIKQLGDFRVDSEDPALFKQWLVLAQPGRTLPTDSPFWLASGRDAPAQWAWGVQALFVRDPAEAIAMIDRARLSMLALSIGLGALIAAWAWQFGGPAAGVIAAGVYALDPNFLGHGAIAKNDVAAALGYAATAWTLYRVGRRVTIGGVLLLAMAVTCTLTMKFSGVLLAGIVPLTLTLRALLPLPSGERAGVRGETLSDESASAAKNSVSGSAKESNSTSHVHPLTPALSPSGRGRAVLVAIAVSVVVGVLAYGGIWAVYGFRYAVSPDPAYSLSVAEQAGAHSILTTIDRAHLLPQSYTFGLAYTLKSAEHRVGYLFGEMRNHGWWYYFPVAMAVKTPLATLALFTIALVLTITPAGRLRLRGKAWLANCLLVPAIIYTAMAMRSSLNLGVRHMLPVYPLAFVAIGVVLSRHRKLAAGLLILLAIETLAAYPNYIAYFNVAAGGSRGGSRILADSNLDWGQDLTTLAEWQKSHPNTRLYLSYFGTAVPATYGVDAINAVAGYAYDPQTQMPDQPGVLAVSVTQLQGLYVSDRLKPFYEVLRQKMPREILGGTLYLYDVPSDTSDAAHAIISP